MALPNEHQLKFNTYKNAKSLMEAIEKRFEGNKESKKVHKTLLKQKYENFNGSSSQGLDQIYDRLQKLISQLEIHRETISQEDVNLKLLRIKGSSSTSKSYKNIAFVSSTNHGSTLKHHSNSSQLDNEDLKQIDPDDLEEMDLKWQMAMLTMRARRFLMKPKKWTPSNQRQQKQETTRRTVPVEETTSNALVSQCDGFGYDWSDQAEEGPTNFALMDYTSLSSSSSNTEVSTCSKACIKSYETLKEHYDNLTKDFNKSQLNVGAYKAGLESVEARLDMYKKNEAIFEEDIKILKLDIKLRDNALTELRKKFEKAKKERDDLKLTLKKFENSSKNLSKLLEIQVSDKFKTGVGFDSQVLDSQVFNSQVNDKYKTGEGYHAVPPPYTRNFMPLKHDLVLADVDEYVFIESITSVPANENETKLKSRKRKPSNAKVEFVKSNEHVKSPRESVKKVENNEQAKYPRKNSQTPRGVSLLSSEKATSVESNLWHRSLGYFTNSKAFRVFNSRTRIVEENLHVKFSEDTPIIARSGPNCLFDIDPLIKSMNYEPVDSPDAGFKPSGEEEKKDDEDPRNEDCEVPSLDLVDLPNRQEGYWNNWVYRIEAIRLFLAYASFKDFVVYQMDVKSAFLYGKIEEEVYVCQPPGSMIGSLMYLTSSRPDIMFAVCACARFQVTHKVSHLHAVKRILKYLKGLPKLGLWYPKDSPFDLEAYTDSDYAGASLVRKSTTGGCQFLGSRLISWQCKKQTVVANSTTEAEYVAASSCCGQVLWIQNQMRAYGYNFMNTKIFIDNESTLCIVKNTVFHSKTKHIEIRHHFIRDSYEKRLIQVIKIHTDHNVADLLIKAFDIDDWNRQKVNAAGQKVSAARQKVSTAGLKALKFVDLHNMVAYMEKSQENADFDEIVDFLNANPIRFALTISPTIYVSYIEQFWYIAKIKTVNNERQIHAKVAGKTIVISESSVRRDLQFNDEDGSGQPSKSQHTPTTASPSHERPILTVASSSHPKRPKNIGKPKERPLRYLSLVDLLPL
ncbi:putative ribonuclease H-like domain-containing protein [Tanacetum coccineum]|uniref:Ribonuclease H-like domain-containing protein n=1 Tax=Tanacetum coccineum TaxID=301880 RepID=A0ABQ5H215_9ASTR